ncbi:MAG: UDP-N-acetylmuramoyl-tripeptide--D-alanyl-D-alanine ligase, partial [Opitutae bacterium]
MVTFDSSELALWSSGQWRLVPPNIQIAGFSIDTRTIRTGQLFVAIRSGNRDGHDFLDYAKKSG